MVRNTFTRYLLLPVLFLLFSSEVKSQITYYVNDNSLTGDSYTSNVGNDANPGTAAAPFATISHAISVAVNGDIIYVDAGTFTGQLEINKQLSLLGHGIGITYINSPDVLALSYTIPPKATVHRPIVYVHDAAGVIIKNITVDGLGKGNANVRFQGIAYRNAGGTIQDCEIKGIRNTPIDGAQAGVAIYANANNGTARTLNLIHNLLIDYQKNATVLAGINLTINVNNNTVSGAGPLNFNVQNGFQVSDEASGSITNNTISNISYTRDAVVAAGILVFGPGSIQASGNTITNVQAGIYYSGAGGSITNNVISNIATGMGVTPYWYAVTVEKGHYTVTGNEINGGGNGAGIEADTYEGDTTTMTATNNSVVNMDEGFVISKFGVGVVSTNINNNSITGSISKTIHNYGTATSNATCNWYGITDGVVVASKITGPVTFTSFSMNGTDNQPATSGFQPVPGACNACITLDVIAPTITLKSSPTVFLTAANTYTVQLSDVLQSVSDNCDPNPSATVSALQVSCTNPGSGSNSAPHQAFIANNATGNQDYTGEQGTDFRVNASNGIVVTQLGAFDHQGNGIMGTQPDGNGGFGIRVAIFNKATHAIVPGLDAVITGNGDAFAGNYRYRNIPAVTLPQGDYIVLAKGYNPNELNGNSYLGGGPYPQGDNAGGAISYLNSVYYADDATGFTYPANAQNTGAPTVLKGATFTYALNQSNMVTITATDMSGNQSQMSTSITVVDTFYTLTTKDITIALNSSGQATIVAADVLQSLKNNCGIDATSSTLQVSPSNFNCSNVGGFALSSPHQPFIATNATGNQDYTGEQGTDFRVNAANGIVVTQLGAFDHQSNGLMGTQPDGNGGFGIRVAIFNKATHVIVPGLDAVISGNGDAFANNYRYKNIPAVTLAAGNYIVIAKGYNPNELNGNSYLAGGPYPQGDDAGGAISYLNSVFYADDAAGFTYPANAQSTGAPTVLKGATFTYKTQTAAGTAVVTLTATDVYGHQKQATANVSVVDNIGPVITTKNITLALDATGHASIQPGDVLQSPITDNCNVNTASITVSPNSFSCTDYSSGSGSSIRHQPFIANNATGNQDYTGEQGTDFRVNATNGIVITQLGAFEHQSNGLMGTQPDGNGGFGIRVAIFNKATHAIVPGLDAVITGNGDASAGNYRYKNIAAVTLAAGNYIVIAKGYNPNELNGNSYLGGGPYPQGDDAGGAISYPDSVFYADDAAGFTYPANAQYTGAPTVLKGATFTYALSQSNLNVSNNKTVTVTAADTHGNVTRATATVTLTNPSGSCSVAASQLYVAQHQTTSVQTTDVPAVPDPLTQGIKVYPNPSGGQFSVELHNLKASKVSLQIMDANGQVIEQKIAMPGGKTPSLSIPVDISKHTAGMYLIKVISADGVQLAKVVVHR